MSEHKTYDDGNWEKPASTPAAVDGIYPGNSKSGYVKAMPLEDYEVLIAERDDLKRQLENTKLEYAALKVLWSASEGSWNALGRIIGYAEDILCSQIVERVRKLLSERDDLRRQLAEAGAQLRASLPPAPGDE